MKKAKRTLKHTFALTLAAILILGFIPVGSATATDKGTITFSRNYSSAIGGDHKPLFMVNHALDSRMVIMRLKLYNIA